MRRIAQRSKRLGATWASAIHPSHIPILNEVYSPSQTELQDARDLISVFAAAVARGDSAIRYKSTLLDYANVRVAMDSLKMAQEAGIDVGEIPYVDIPSFHT
ncbi:hypothetical protein IVB16_32295 [Bradyrhizobium sp. 183]|uniref:hypothetical protein n=1 Tax=unclassified Bradyrhizobium TaxID=2631580 RepID=UPI001FFF0349|nr:MULTISPECIES: hypothetical protein [unclassified Bradyrhizobium]UPJ79371.1 hypothetical protein IVB17_32295 [Bradyrhizobium sp. 184]UPJ87165.1 hypothetical protein IVB16_32295 [Bradyrhizobium sp. 183]